jgi:hypothetical protein
MGHSTKAGMTHEITSPSLKPAPRHCRAVSFAYIWQQPIYGFMTLPSVDFSYSIAEQ